MTVVPSGASSGVMFCSPGAGASMVAGVAAAAARQPVRRRAEAGASGATGVHPEGVDPGGAPSFMRKVPGPPVGVEASAGAAAVGVGWPLALRVGPACRPHPRRPLRQPTPPRGNPPRRSRRLPRPQARSLPVRWRAGLGRRRRAPATLLVRRRAWALPSAIRAPPPRRRRPARLSWRTGRRAPRPGRAPGLSRRAR